MQYENKILNFHIYLYFPSNIFKKFKNIKIKGLTYYILTCIISLVFTRNKSKHTIQYARVAQWWSTSLPRRGSRVRSPSRALMNKRTIPNGIVLLFSSPARARKFDVYAPLRSAQAEVPRTSCAVSRSHEKKNDTKSVSFFFSSPARARKFDVYAPLRSAQSEVPRTSCAVSRFFYLQRKP